MKPRRENALRLASILILVHSIASLILAALVLVAPSFAAGWRLTAIFTVAALGGLITLAGSATRHTTMFWEWEGLLRTDKIRRSAFVLLRVAIIAATVASVTLLVLGSAPGQSEAVRASALFTLAILPGINAFYALCGWRALRSARPEWYIAGE